MRQEVLARLDSPADTVPPMENIRKGVTRTWPARGMICDSGEAHLQRTVQMECERPLANRLKGTLSLPQAVANDIMSSIAQYPANNVTPAAELWITDTSERRRVTLLYEPAMKIIWIGGRPRTSTPSPMPSLLHPGNCMVIPELDEQFYARTLTSVHCTRGLRFDVREYSSEVHTDSSARGSYRPNTHELRNEHVLVQ